MSTQALAPDVANLDANLDGPCCFLNLCCPPAKAAAAMVAYLGLSTEYIPAFTAMFAKFGVMVPLELPVSKADLLSIDKATCKTRLARLQRHVKREMIDLLDTMGFPMTEED